MKTRVLKFFGLAFLLAVVLPQFAAAELIPPLEAIKKDRPRLLLRPSATPCAISLGQLRGAPKGSDYKKLLAQLRENRSASAQAMVWLLTGDRAAADSAVERLLRYEQPDDFDTFHVHSRLTDFGLAYDWLCTYDGFTKDVRAAIRRRVMPTAWQGYRNSRDHIFHNYVWMSAGGTAIWSLAVAGEDTEADSLFRAVSSRFNTSLYPAMRYLDGLPSEPLGYWFYYDFSPCLLSVLAAQSAFEQDLAGKIRTEQGDWLQRHFLNMIHGVTPDLRFITWGDMQSGSNGGVTLQYAGLMDAGAWLLDSPEGAWMSRWLAEKRGLDRFYGSTPVFYMIYTRNLTTQPAPPALSFLAGNSQAGHFMARSAWTDDAVIVTFRCTDHYGDHNHHDQGSFIVYRKGLLAVDPPVYRQVRGPQQPTSMHNTLLIGGQEQRDCRGQSFQTIEEFERNRLGGPLLETGDVLFYREAGGWAAVAGQFAQAYDSTLLKSCVRQLLFIRPNLIVVLDQLEAPAGVTLAPVTWLLQLPQKPELKYNPDRLEATNGEYWLTLKGLAPESEIRQPEITETEVGTWKVAYTYDQSKYAGKNPGKLTIAYLISIEDGPEDNTVNSWMISGVKDALDLQLAGRTFRFSLKPPYEVRSADWWH